MKTIISFRPLGAVLLLLALASGFGFAQNINGTIAGLVSDANGAPISGARIALLQSDRQTRREVVSDDAGQFRLTGLLPGQYKLEVTAAGFATYKREMLAVLVGDSAFLNVTLQAGGVNEVVTIAGQLDDISRARSSGSRGSSLTEAEMTDLPTLSGNVSRSYRAQVFLLPGVTPARAAHSPFSINGLRPVNTVNVMVDGADFNNPNTGALLGAGLNETPVSQEVLTGTEVQTNSFKAEYGRAAGGTINLVTQSGGNEWRGKVYDFYRNDAFDARNALLQRKGDLSRHQFGVAVGGPVVKNKVFIFLSGEGLADRATGFTSPKATFTADERARAVAAVKPLLDLYPLPNVGTTLFEKGDILSRLTGRWWFGKVDYVINPAHALGFRFTKADHLPVTEANEFGQGQASISDNRSYVLSLTSNLNPRLLNEARVYYTGRQSTTIPYTQLLGNAAVNGVVGLLNITGVERAGSQFRDFSMLHNYQFADDLSLTAGQHGLKFGAVLRQVQQNTTGNANTDGTLTFDSREAFLQGRPRTYVRVIGDTRLDQRATEFAAYAQDDWRVRPNLSFNYGVRYELYTTPVDKLGRVTPNYTTDKNNFAPRFGFSYSPGKQTALVVRGGYGLFYTPLPMRYLGNTRFTPPRVQTFTVLSPTFPNLLAGQSSISSDLTITDPNLVQPYAQQYNLTVDYQLPGSQLVLSMGYVGSRGSNFGVTSLPNGGARLTAAQRPDPTKGVISLLETTAGSSYHSWQTSLRGRITNGVQVRAAYTFAKALDDLSSDTALFISESNRALDRGRADIDIRHVLTTAVMWSLPGGGNLPRGLKQIVGGWNLAPVVTYRTGTPFSLLSGTETPDGSLVNRINDISNTLVRTPGGFLGLQPASGLTLASLRTAVIPVRGAIGTLGRNTETGDSYFDVSAGLHKDFTITERIRAQFRTEVFNLFNTVNYSAYVNSIADPRFGQASAADAARAIQLSWRVTF